MYINKSRPHQHRNFWVKWKFCKLQIWKKKIFSFGQVFGCNNHALGNIYITYNIYTHTHEKNGLNMIQILEEVNINT